MPEVTSTQAAEIIGVSHMTIHRRVDDGRLNGRRQGLDRQIRVDLDELKRFAQEYGYRFDENLAQQYTSEE